MEDPWGLMGYMQVTCWDNGELKVTIIGYVQLTHKDTHVCECDRLILH